MADKELSVEEKAAQIGADIGVEDKDIPEYDIQPDDAKPVEQEVEAEDKRLGKTREDQEAGHKTDRKILTNREKRQLKKRRINEKFDAKDSLIKQQQDQINALASRLNEVDGKLSNFDRSQLEQAMQETQRIFQQAEANHMDAFNTGDGAKASQAMRAMYESQRRIEQLQAVGARQSIQQKTEPQTDTVVASRAQDWASKNTWFKQGGVDDDSFIAEGIATKLVREGFDPKTDEYWDELDDRLESKGIGERTYNDDEDEEQTQQIKQVEKKPIRKSAPVGGSGGRGDMAPGKIAVTLPTALIESMKQSGAWDDPVRKHAIIKDYQRIRAEERA